jgi:hypothetical protein
VEVYRTREDADAARPSLNRLLVDGGHALAYDGGTKGDESAFLSSDGK